MNQYEVLVTTPINGTDRAVGDVVELDSEVADALVASGNIQLKPVDGAGEGAQGGNAVAPSAANAAVITKRSLTMRSIAQADLDANPVLVELGAAVGDYAAVDKAA